ncbi:MAG: ParB/RepB/Spo0J family partition protein [Clostridia bacterium]|nr:ParB/RepB/Spo0J family partition protein [Clostridia bacterium]
MPNDIAQLKTPIEEFQPDPNQPRKYFDETALTELSESIKQYGVLQPIIYYVNEHGQKIIVAGERRYQAAKKAGLTEIPAISIDGSEADKVALVENILRQDLTPLEEAEALQQLKEKYKYSNEKLAQVVAKAPSTISETLLINKLPAAIKEQYKAKPEIQKKDLIRIARMRSEAGQMKAYNKLMKIEPGNEEPKNTEKEGKENYKLTLSFLKSLTSKLSKSNIVISDEREKETLKKQIAQLNDALNGFIDKYGLR